MDTLDEMIKNQESYLHDLESRKRILRNRPFSDKVDERKEENKELKVEIEQIEQEIENIYREISILKIRRLMNV